MEWREIEITNKKNNRKIETWAPRAGKRKRFTL